jgi:hypothetical protein
LAVVLIVGVVAVWWLIPKMVGKGINAADRKLIRPNSYAKAQETVRGGLSLTAGIAPAELLSRVVSEVGAATTRPATMARVYLKQRTSDGAVFAFGSGIAGDVFIAAVEISELNGGSRGVFHILSWKESGADVSGLTTMRQLQDKVQQSVLAAGGVVNVVA